MSHKLRPDHLETAKAKDAPKLSLSGICATDPSIEFKGRVFVFTGISERATRREIGDIISSRNGVLSERVPESDYLIVGCEGNPAWAFACYGRKVEMAMNLRKSGSKIAIVNERDFWDAIGD